MVMKMNIKNYSKKKKTVLALGIFTLLYFTHQWLTKPAKMEIPLPTVTVQKPILKEIVNYVTQTGTTVAFNSVNLVARVAGYLDAIEFTDGTVVKKGKELFIIQPQPYWEQLKAAEATVAANKADYEYSKLEYERQKRMYKQNATSLNNVQKWLAKMEASKANLDKAIADEANAAITYSYTHINAPFDGRIGRHLVDVGNYVGNGEATNLATIEQIDKLYVYFNLNELDLIQLRNAARAMGFKRKDLDTVPVYVNFQNETGQQHKATLDFVNTGLNAATGTMELRAILENKDYLFVPGLFVQVKIAVSLPKKELTIPSTAVLYDQIGPYILVVDKNNIVHLNHVTLGAENNGFQTITQGVKADDKVVINGIQFATPGNQVMIKE
ncbi:MAG: efflux transporter periplasmic adaptor subunit [Legionella sp.]|nr:MAG: efflux transporter periplasmic adaptor subunit [Legionella sp.]PJD99852.1 MAG: efflux transporter periplasmic adaptor subunit [Legionella sp.]